jgi:hypothetical protein
MESPGFLPPFSPWTCHEVPKSRYAFRKSIRFSKVDSRQCARESRKSIVDSRLRKIYAIFAAFLNWFDLKVAEQINLPAIQHT